MYARAEAEDEADSIDHDGIGCVNLTVSIKSWHYVHLFILHMRNDECKSTV
jgi:hypothetical protein